MRAPLMMPTLFFFLGMGLSMHWQPPGRACVGGGLICSALVLLVGAQARGALMSGALLLGLGVVLVQAPGPLVVDCVYFQGRVLVSQGRSALVELDSLDGLPAQGNLALTAADRLPAPGERIAGFGMAAGLPERNMPGSWDPWLFAHLGRAQTLVRLQEWVRLGTEKPMVYGFEGVQHGGLLWALATGNREQIAPDEMRLLRKTGTAHLVAISGLHVGLVAGAATACMKGLVTLLSVLGVRVWICRGLVSIGALWAASAYAGLAGWPISSLRALWMIGAVFLMSQLSRGVCICTSISLAAIAVALGEPARVGTVSFWLSFGAVIGIFRFSGALGALVPGALPWIVRAAWKAMATSIGAVLGTLPVCAWLFQELPLFSFAANLLAVPLVGFVAVPAALLGLGGVESAAWVGGWALHLALVWVSWCEGPVLHPAVGPWGVLLLVCGLLCPGRWDIRVAWTFLVLSLRAWPRAGLCVTFLSVGQGDAALIEDPSGRRILLDGGPPSVQVLHWLRRRGIYQLDEVVGTHPHPDHIGGLLPVISELKVGRLRLDCRGVGGGCADLLEMASKRGVPVVRPDAPGLNVLHPVGTNPGLSENDASIVVRLEQGATSVLMTGDIESEAEALLQDRLSPVGWLKLAHHGSRTSSTRAFLDRARPRVVLISAGANNRFGHPSPEVLARVRHARILRTDRVGTVQLHAWGQQEFFRTWSRRQGWSAWRDSRRSPRE